MSKNIKNIQIFSGENFQFLQLQKIIYILHGHIFTGFIQARPSKIQGLFKDFSRTNLTIFKDLLLRNTYTYLSIIETLGPATLAFGGGGIIILSLVLSLWVDAVVEVSVLTLVSFSIKKFEKVPDKDC